MSPAATQRHFCSIGFGCIPKAPRPSGKAQYPAHRPSKADRRTAENAESGIDKKNAPELSPRGSFGIRWGKGGLAWSRKSSLTYFWLSATATATATVAPTMGLLPMPRKPIISTWAGTELEPANWASECIRPMVSVMP